MDDKKVVVAVFEDEQDMMKAITEAKKSEAKPVDAFTPFPVHGLDKLLGISPSRLDIVAFIFGCIGFSSAVALQVWTIGIDLPMNIGGKPAIALPSFIPISFELTVLITALGMAFTFLVISKLIPGVQPKIYDPRQTNDHFVVLFQQEANNFENIRETCMEFGALEVRSDKYKTTLYPYPIPIKIVSDDEDED